MTLWGSQSWGALWAQPAFSRLFRGKRISSHAGTGRLKGSWAQRAPHDWLPHFEQPVPGLSLKHSALEPSNFPPDAAAGRRMGRRRAAGSSAPMKIGFDVSQTGAGKAGYGYFAEVPGIRLQEPAR